MAIKVKLSDLMDGVETPDEQFRSYLNVDTGAVFTFSDDDFRHIENMEEAEDEEERAHEALFCDLDEENVEAAKEILYDEGNYLPLPSLYDLNEHKIMEKFCLEIKDPKLQETMSRSIQGSGAFRRFKENIRNYKIEEEWFSYREEKLKELLIEWCRENGVQYLDNLRKRVNTPIQLVKGNQTETLTEIKMGRYRHFKGGEYQVTGIAKHSETLEEFVVYQALYGEKELWIRPKENFREKVIFEGKERSRFEFMRKV